MTLEQLTDKITVGVCLDGHFRVSIEYRGKCYSTTSTNTLALDRIHDQDISDTKVACSYTLKGAFQALWNECKRNNNLK